MKNSRGDYPIIFEISDLNFCVNLNFENSVKKFKF